MGIFKTLAAGWCDTTGVRRPSAAALALAGVAALASVALTPAAQAAETIRIGVLKFGTVNWELDVIQRHKLDEANEISLDVVELANNQATTVALLSGDVDMIVSDWLWVSRERSLGKKLTFVPYSSSVGAIMVPPGSGIKTLADLKGKTLAVAGGPLDKSWLMLRGLAKKEYGFDLKDETEQVFGAPPLLAKKAEQGEVDAVLNYWHYSARLEAKGFTQLIGANDAAMKLGARGPISAIGYVFNEDWANEHVGAVKNFIQASRDAKELMRTSDAVWEELRAATRAGDDATLAALRDRFREGIPDRPIAEEMEDTARIYDVLAEIGGEKLVGPPRR
ncbi:ABC transporter substrate-binding protein [Breoghania sp. L-A4]|uniref:ABC transporter substrate-binding protein n=1 Tax=Breoghania sp. L-A4 TaxID=2304600 RepID=UPI0020C0CCB1|nr:ABC transporter substrate-binding protein [Breoghania sp. L-A4]